MNKYEVGFIDEFIGVYYADNEKEAIECCKKQMDEYKFKPNASLKEWNFIVNLIKEK